MEPNSEIGEGAFKLMTVVIRHCDEYQIKEKDLDFLLARAAHNLEDIHNHSPTFALLKVHTFIVRWLGFGLVGLVVARARKKCERSSSL